MRKIFSFLLLFVPAVPSWAQATLYAPQLAIGGGWTTTVAIQNVSGEPCGVLVSFIGADGADIIPDMVHYNGLTTKEHALFEGFPGNSGGRYELSLPGNLVTGWIPFVVLIGPVPLISVTCRLLDGGGVVQSAVEVSVSAPALTWNIIAKSSSTEDLGVAVVNPEASDVEVAFDLYDDFHHGNPYAAAKRTLMANQQMAIFLRELFPQLPGDDGGGNPVSSGVLKVSAASPIVVTAVQGIFSTPGQFLMSGVSVVPEPVP